MDPQCYPVSEIIAAAARMFVLIISALTGALCIYLGWRLYTDTIISKTSGELRLEKISIKLAAASPGIFFVAFGMWLLVTLVNNRFSLEEGGKENHVSRIENNSNYMNIPALHVTEEHADARLIAVVEDKSASAATESSPCLIRYRKLVFFQGETESDFRSEVRTSLALAIQAIREQPSNKNASPQTIAERAQAITNLQELLQMVPEN